MSFCNSTVQAEGPDHRAQQEQLEVCVEKILKSENVPPFREHAEELMAAAADPETNSSRLAGTILKDVGLTAEMLKMANSSLYNRSGRQILDIAHAVTFLGWEAIGNLVAAAHYIERYANRSPAARELMLMSVLGARHARQTAVMMHCGKPDEAYLLGLLRRVGEVLIACHFPFEYCHVLVTMQQEKIGLDEAFLRILGFRPDDLGDRLTAAWGMPPHLRLCMGGAEPAGSAAVRSLASIVNFGDDLAEQIYRRGKKPEAITGRKIIDTRGRQVALSSRELGSIVDSVSREMSRMYTALNVPVERLRLERQAENARKLLESMPIFDARSLAGLDAVIDSGAQKLASGDFELGAFILALLEGVRSSGFERAVFGLINEQRTMISGRLSSGADHFEFVLDSGDGPLWTALHARNDVLVDCSRDGRFALSALVSTQKPRAFALLPILVDRKVAACLYADRRDYSSGLEQARPALMRVRDLMASAMRVKASGLSV